MDFVEQVADQMGFAEPVVVEPVVAELVVVYIVVELVVVHIAVEQAVGIEQPSFDLAASAFRLD